MTRKPALWIVALTVFAACSAPSPNAPHPIPAPPVLGARIDRVGRPLTGNALIFPFGPEADADRRKEEYNRAAQADWPSFVPDLEATLAIYDGFDGVCGNQWLAAPTAAPARYRTLANLLADDRLWIDTRAAACTQFLAVERGLAGDCGGRTPLYDASDGFRSMLVLGQITGVSDGVDRDDRDHSATDFPFLAAP
jgi:hypothetical protein